MLGGYYKVSGHLGGEPDWSRYLDHPIEINLSIGNKIRTTNIFNKPIAVMMQKKFPM